MKIILKQIISAIVVLWSKIYTYGISKKIMLRRDELYTLWIKDVFGFVGNNFRMENPCVLQGEGVKSVYIGDSVWIQKYTVIGC